MVIDVIIQGYQKAFNNWRLALLIYLIQLTMVVFVGVQVYQIIDASIGTSLELEQLKTGFNYTVFHDMLNVHGSSFYPIFYQLRWLILSYLIVSVFIHAGSLSVLNSTAPIWSSFWKGGAKYFLKFMLIGIFFFILTILWTVLVWLPYVSQLFFFVENWVAEYLIVWLLIGLVVLYFLGLAFLFACSLNARLFLLMDGVTFFKSIKNGFLVTINRIKHSYAVMMVFALLITMIYIVNFLFEWNIGMTSSLLIIAALVLQQVVVILKIVTRLAIYASFILLKN